MAVEPIARPIPFTSNRALTELVHSRKQLDEARRSLELGLEIFHQLDEEAAWAPIRSLEDVLGQIEQAEAALWELAQ